MTDHTKQQIVAGLGDLSIFLTILSGLPYAFGDVSTLLPPKAKIIVTIGMLLISGLIKFVQRAISILNPPGNQTAQPATPGVAGATPFNPFPNKKP